MARESDSNWTKPLNGSATRYRPSEELFIFPVAVVLVVELVTCNYYGRYLDFFTQRHDLHVTQPCAVSKGNRSDFMMIQRYWADRCKSLTFSACEAL